MLASERQKLIVDILLEKKHAMVADLASEFDVSFETIRRDLKVLEKSGMIEKSYGEARIKERVSHYLDYETLSHLMVEIKKKIAEAAISYVEPHDCIYIDYATTCQQLVELLGEVPVTVMTNSLEALCKLVRTPNVEAFSPGGMWDQANHAFVGKSTLDCLDDFRFDKAFVSCRALSMEHGLSDRTEMEASLRRKILQCSNEVYLMVDYSKFDKAAFVRTMDFSRITGIITDATLNEEWKEFLEEHNIKYINCYTVREEDEE